MFLLDDLNEQVHAITPELNLKISPQVDDAVMLEQMGVFGYGYPNVGISGSLLPHQWDHFWP